MNILTVLLQWGPHRAPHGPMAPAGGAGSGMAPWGAWGTGVGLLPTVLSLLLLLAVVVGVVYLVVGLPGRESGDGTDAVAVLRRRYAQGEIDDEEFDRRQRRLDGGPS